MWVLPVSMLVFTTLLAIPLSKYLAWIMDGGYRAPGFLRWFEKRLDSGPQDWKQYTAALLIFNIVLFVFGYVVLALQPLMPLNPRGLGMLSPTTIFHTVCSFITNTNLQHYSGDQHLSNFSQIFFIITNMFLSASVGFCGLTAIIRAFRGESKVGNYFVDMWRVMVYMFVPVALFYGVLFIQQGMPMTYQSTYQVSTLEPGAMESTDKGEAKQQTIVVGPVAAVIPIKQIGTNGGGFYGMNSAHPLENPSAFTNFLECVAMMLFPFSLVLMYGRMLNRVRHGVAIFSVMMVMMIGTIVWAIYFDTMKPNPGLTAHTEGRTFSIPSAGAPGGKRTFALPAVAGLPVDQHLGNLEGKELRFGTLEFRKLRTENRMLREALDDCPLLELRSAAMARLLQGAQRAAASDATILLTGESGSGKNVLASQIHRWSRRRERPFVTVNCSTISEHLLESELFGHVRGSFTGGIKGKPGRLEAAEGGTLFIDEVGELNTALQAKLLRFVQERAFERVGGEKTIEVDVRMIAASNRDLASEVTTGRFREDLFYRLNVITLHVPALRERTVDILALANRLLAGIAIRNHRPGLRLSPDASAALTRHRWPGNIRELRNVLERASILCRGAEITAEHLPDAVFREPLANRAPPMTSASLEKVKVEYIRRVLVESPTMEDAAATLGINASTLWRKRKRYGLSRRDSGNL